jgi:hypothetical protein
MRERVDDGSGWEELLAGCEKSLKAMEERTRLNSVKRSLRNTKSLELGTRLRPNSSMMEERRRI